MRNVHVSIKPNRGERMGFTIDLDKIIEEIAKNNGSYTHDLKYSGPWSNFFSPGESMGEIEFRKEE